MAVNSLIACHECDLLVRLPVLDEGTKANCPRCDNHLSSSHVDAHNRVIAYAITSFIFLLLTFQFPFLTFSAQGQNRTVTLLQSIAVMITEDFYSLALLIFISIILVPGLFLLSTIYVYLSLKCKRLLPNTLNTLKLMGQLQHWNMAEIFLIGILVSLIKIVSLAEIELGLSFWAYVIFILTMTITLLHIDNVQVWQWFKQKYKPGKSHPINLAYQSCHICNELAHITAIQCQACNTILHHRNENSLQKTWALLFTSILLYIPANILPIMRTNFLGEETANTILEGIFLLWSHGSYPIALIIFIASVLVPVGKILALLWLCYSAQIKSDTYPLQKTQLYRITELIGRWSMLDVFVVAILVALIQLGNIMSIDPGWGAIAFAAMVIITVMAALSFDPRLIWDPINKRPNI